MAADSLELYRRWLQARGYAPTTAQLYVNTARRLKLHLPPEEALAALQAELTESGLAPSTVKSYLAAARLYYRSRGWKPEYARPGADPVWDDFRAYLVYEVGLASSTVPGYIRAARAAEGILRGAGTTAARASREQILRVLDVIRSSGVSQSGLRVYVIGIRHYFEFLQQRGVRPDNPARSIRTPPQIRPLPRALSAEQVLSLLDSVPPGPRPLDLRDRALLELLASSGLRASEAASLRVHDMDFHRMEIRLVGKGGRARLAFFTERCAHYVRLYLVEARPLLADPSQDLLFVTRRGGRLSGPQMWSIVAKWAKKAGLECSPHVLRHSLATALLERGVNLRYIQEILGHARLATTEIYTRVRPDKLSSVYRETVPFK